MARGGPAPSGTVAVAETARGELVVFGSLAGLAPNSGGGIRVHEGLSCAEAAAVGGPFFPGLAEDPWAAAAWASDGRGASSVAFEVAGFSVGAAAASAAAGGGRGRFRGGRWW